MPISDYTPTLADVAAEIPQRTEDGLGNEVGTFNPADAQEQERTKPTAEQVTALIARAVREVSSAVGSDLPDGPADDRNKFRDAAKGLAALYAAMLVELRYYAAQINGGASPYNQMKTLWDDNRKRLIEAVAEAEGGGGGESVGETDIVGPSYDFPPFEPLWGKRF